MLDISELKGLSRQELEDKIISLKKVLFEKHTEQKTGRLEKPHLIRDAKRDIARILTILNEKKGSK